MANQEKWRSNGTKHQKQMGATAAGMGDITVQ